MFTLIICKDEHTKPSWKSKREQITRVVSLPPSLFRSELLFAACKLWEIDVCWMTSLISFYQTCDRKIIPSSSSSSSSSSSTVIIIKSSPCSRVSSPGGSAAHAVFLSSCDTENAAATENWNGNNLTDTERRKFGTFIVKKWVTRPWLTK